ncbi:signal peptide peptidase-domain-containing protein [Podospora appendiculata]|uniref:Signal peptide peptidase-domain-containing protein n=1 Tax=Podospora appendiculata TaxID=314037 RepID=A0AAE0XHQ7_9PEZI|nr:signal peptide peptidase-domain-containing protein [Podospora appendiculata]
MASENATVAIAADGPSNSTANAVPHTFALSMLLQPDFLLVETQVILSALSIIWLGAHGSLRRPPSAALAKTKGRDKKKKPKDDQFTEGFSASDAIMLPIMAGVVLIGLYYLIEWLHDPDMLNKIIRVYLSVVSVASLGRLTGDTLEVLTSLVFPNMWADRSGKVYHIDSSRCCQYQLGPDGSEVMVGGNKSPFPGFLSRAALSDKTLRKAWEVRHILTEDWTLRLAMHGLFTFRFDLTFNSILGFILSLLVTISYYATGWHVFSNLLGAAFSYSAFAIMSPTSFGIGTMVLAGLFVYDVIMVFYTPFMITVAKSIDAPIKLVFHSASGVSMLGLGDIVIPGLLMGLALRFDLYRYYQKKITHEPIQLTSQIVENSAAEETTVTETQYRSIKAPYVDPRGQWGDRFWSTKLGKTVPVPAAASATAATAFPKPYFYATIFGYLVGMLVTLTMLLVFHHGQPALLYLVPGVAGSVWLTALLRGELKDVWAYTEDGSLDTEDVVVELDGNGQVIKEVSKKTPDDKGSATDDKPIEGAAKPGTVKKSGQRDDEYDVFSFSITAPRNLVDFKLD